MLHFHRAKSKRIVLEFDDELEVAVLATGFVVGVGFTGDLLEWSHAPNDPERLALLVDLMRRLGPERSTQLVKKLQRIVK